MTAEVLIELGLTGESDVFAARQIGRECAAAFGMDRLDAIRVATAISEVGRDVVATGGGRARFRVDAANELCIDVIGIADRARWATSIAAAERLVDGVTPVTQQPGAGVTLCKRFGASVDRSAPRLDEVRNELAALSSQNPTDELREQNRELIAALDEVRAQKSTLEVVNHELEETNRGVMALYSELSEELERTNRGVVALYAEIDDKNERLREASEAKSRFLRSISHELRTPVNSILGLSRLLTDPAAGESLTNEQAAQVAFVRASAQDLLSLVNELLDLAKAESGRLDAVVDDVDVAALFDELRGTTEPLLRPGVALEVARPTGLRPLRTDPALLRHVLRNLLSNAAKFTDAGTVRLSAEADESCYRLTVQDTGIGMSAEDRGQIFDEFYQARTPLHATAKGTGLGLSFVQRVATALGATIEVSTELGAGSTFVVVLPSTPEGGQP